VTTAAATDANVRIHALLEEIRNGRILEAMEEFDADDVVMTEPAHTCAGKAANIEREKAFVASVKEFRGFETPMVAIDGDTSVYENVMEWTDRDGKEIRLEQVVVARWEDGRIVHERFYHHAG
jgi:ketosteroid isomerase-like protein